MKIVYIAHPVGGDVENNIKDIIRIIGIINTSSKFRDIVPCAPYIADIFSMNDDNPVHRLRGIRNDKALIMRRTFDEIWLTGNKISSGMKDEINLFNILELPVVNYLNCF